MEKKHKCCTPEDQMPRYVDCVGCDKKPIEGATLSYAQAQKDSFSIMEKKQNSVEWLGLELNIIFHDLTPELWEQVEVKFQQAKAMHKEEIVDAYEQGDKYKLNFSGEHWYNETFGGNHEQD